jgi:hypothetical protein
MVHSDLNPSGDRVVYFVDEEKFTAYSHPLTLSQNHCRVCEGRPRSKDCAADRRTQAPKARSRHPDRRNKPDAAHEPRARAHVGLVIYGSDRARPGSRYVSSPRRDGSCRAQTTSTCVRPRSSKMWGKVAHPVLASVCQHIACEQARHDRHAELSPGLRPDRDRRRIVRALIARRMVAQRRMRSRNAQGRHPVR